jgi:predicted outer membrane repeat protein
VTNCTFSGNTAVWGGGFSADYGTPTVTGCSFSTNVATDWGGGMCIWELTPIAVTDCDFTGNSASLGGGMYIYNAYNPTVTVTNCTFSDNSAVTLGGGMCGGGDVTVIDTALCGNSSPQIFGEGQIALQGTSMLPFCPIPVCRGDSDGDGVVNVTDFLDLLALWGPCP